MKVQDNNGKICEVVNRTTNSVCVLIPADKKTWLKNQNRFTNPITCTQWFTEVDFNKLFKIF